MERAPTGRRSERRGEPIRLKSRSRAASEPLEAEGERLEGELLGDVEVEAAAGVLDELGGLRGRRRVEALGRGASWSRRSRLKATSSAPAAIAARSRNQAAQSQAEVEDLGAAPAAGPLRLVGGLAGRALDPRRLLLLERLAGRGLGLLAGLLRRLQQLRSPGALTRSRRRSPPRRSARPRRGVAAAGVESRKRARSRSPAARRAAAATSSSGSPIPASAASTASAGEWREIDRLAARGDRLEQRRGLGAEQDQVDELGRLLERLQQRVLALVAHRLRRLDDEDPAAALERPVGGGADHPLAHLLDQVLGAARREPDQVGVRARGRAGRGDARHRGHRRRRRGSRRRRPAPRRACRRPRGPREEVGVRGPGRERRAQRQPRPGLVLRSPQPARRSPTASITRSWTSSTVPAPSITTTRSEAIWAISS